MPAFLLVRGEQRRLVVQTLRQFVEGRLQFCGERMAAVQDIDHLGDACMHLLQQRQCCFTQRLLPCFVRLKQFLHLGATLRHELQVEGARAALQRVGDTQQIVRYAAGLPGIDKGNRFVVECGQMPVGLTGKNLQQHRIKGVARLLRRRLHRVLYNSLRVVRGIWNGGKLY